MQIYGDDDIACWPRLELLQVVGSGSNQVAKHFATFLVSIIQAEHTNAVLVELGSFYNSHPLWSLRDEVAGGLGDDPAEYFMAGK